MDRTFSAAEVSGVNDLPTDEAARAAAPPARIAPLLKFRRGTQGYATVLWHVRNAPCTARQLGERASTTYTNAHRLLRQLHFHRLIHIASWIRTSVKGPCSAVFAFGDGADAQPPMSIHDRALPSSSRCFDPPPVHIEMLTFVAAWRELENPQTARSLQEAVGGNRNVVNRLLNHLHALELVRIAEWDKTLSGPPTAAYARGRKRDADRPKPKDPALAWREYDARRRARARTIRIAHLTAAPMLAAA